MSVSIVEFDLESISDENVKTLNESISRILNGDSYTRADLENIESAVPGSLSEAEDFNITEYPSRPSKINHELIKKRLDVLKDSLGDLVNSRISSLIHRAYDVVDKVKSFQSCIRLDDDRIIRDEVDLDRLYTSSYPYDSILDTKFNSIASDFAIGEIKGDVNANTYIRSLNLDIRYLMERQKEINNSNPFNGQMLAELGGIKVGSDCDISFTDVSLLFSNPNDALEKINKIEEEIITNLAIINPAILSRTWCTDNYIESKTRDALNAINKYSHFIDDETSLLILKLVKLIKYK